MTARRLLKGIAPVLFYGLIACIALSPLLFRAATHTGGEWTTDYYHFHWNYWWIRHALTTPGLNIYETNFVLYPYTTNLAFHTLTPFWFPAWALLEPLFGGGRAGTLPAMDVIMVISMTLTGWTFYQLLRREGVHPALALPFGGILQICSGMMLAAMLTTINYLSGFWMPLNLLTWGEVARARGRARFLWGALLGVGFYGTMMTDYQHMLFLAFLIVPYGIWTLIKQPSWNERGRLIGAGALALAIMTILLWVVGPLPYILKYDFSALSPQPIENAGGIPFPDGYFSRFGTYDRGITLGSLVLPLVVLGTAISIVLRGRAHRVTGSIDRRTPVLRASKWFWLALMILPLILSAGPFISIGGTQVEAPYAWMHRLFGGLFRSPARFDYAIITAGLLFAGKALSPLLTGRRLRPVWVAPVLVLLVALDGQLFIPMPIQPVTRDYAFYTDIGKETGGDLDNEVVLEVPVAGGSGEAWVGDFKPMEAEFYGITHGKRMLNGAIARAPLNAFWYWLYDDPMLAWLGGRRYLEPENVEAQLRQRIPDWKIGYIVVHGDWIGLEGPTFQEIVGYFNRLRDMVCPVSVEDNTVFYRTSWHPYGCPARTPQQVEPNVYQIDIGEQQDLFYTGWGWHYAEKVFDTSLRWTGEYPQADLYLDLPPGAYELSIAAQAFHETRHLRMLINGAPLDEAAAVSVDSLGVYRFRIPPTLIGSGSDLTVTLDYDGWIVPEEVGEGGDERRLAIAVDWLRFEKTDG